MTNFFSFFAFVMIVASPFLIKKFIDNAFELKKKKLSQESERGLKALGEHNRVLRAQVDQLQDRVIALETIVTDSKYQLDQKIKNIA